MRTHVLMLFALLGLSLMSCSSGTQIKLANQTGVTLSSVVVSAYPTATVDSVQFQNVTSGTTTDEAEWMNDQYLTVTLSSVTSGGTTYSVTPTSVTLDSKKTNLLTLTLSGSTITYTRSTE